MRFRGTEPVPSDIAIVAIDEKSIQRFGRFPWPRSVIARALDGIGKQQPRAVALDILFTDPTTRGEDQALAEAIGRLRNAVVAAQLSRSEEGEAVWLKPLPLIARSAAATAHVNVHAESESVAREIPLRSTDDQGQILYAMPIEALRIGERISPAGIIDRHASVLAGSREIPVQTVPGSAVLTGLHSSSLVRAARMPIDYIGPTGSFAPVTYSIADVLDGALPSGRLTDKYVLVGATAPSLGDQFASPFTHSTGVSGEQNGMPMPGVEVLANALNTILLTRVYMDIPWWLSFLWAAATAAVTLALLSAAQGQYELLKQFGVFIAVPAGIASTGLACYKGLFVYPPVAAQVTAFASAGVLGLLRRSISAGSELDKAIRGMARASESLIPQPASSAAAEAIARITGCAAVVILRSCGRRRYETVSVFGLIGSFGAGERKELLRIRSAIPLQDVREVRVDSDGLLLLGKATDDPLLAEQDVRAAIAIARPLLGQASSNLRPEELMAASPRGLEARTRDVSRLNTHMGERWGFIDLALRATQDGLMITGPDGGITFCNPAAAEALRATPEAIIGTNLLDRLSHIDSFIDPANMLRQLLGTRLPVEREISIRGNRWRRYMLRIAPVGASGGVAGLIVSMADITRQQELQQTKNDVISLVSHEMRTPLTAIQGMSELLAGFDMPADRQRQLSQAINDESRRLTRMVSIYLDLTRLESGAAVLHKTAIRPEMLAERLIMLLEPLAAQKNMRLVRRLATPLPVVVADPDLLTRALENLVSNAIKYGREGTEIQIGLACTDCRLLLSVKDEGQGIAKCHLDRLFDKFYRVPAAENADIPGNGLGLSLVREITELHGGTVSVQSEQGAGSIFVLSIPLSSQQDQNPV